MKYIELLLGTNKQNNIRTKIRIIIEGYNPKAVETNAKLFCDLAEKDGFEISDLDFHDRNKYQKCSIYFDCIKENDKWKIRVADHNHNEDYNNNSSVDITADKIDSVLVLKQYNYFKRLSISEKDDKENVIDIIQNTSFAITFVMKYQSNPKWILKLCEKYNINPIYKNTDWFKITLQNKCNEISSQSPKFEEKYKETNLYYWTTNNRLNHF